MPCADCNITDLLNKKEPAEREFAAQDNRTYHIYDYPYNDVDGTPLILRLGVDITENRQVKEAMRVGEIRYYTLFNSMMEGFALHEIICDQEGKPCDYRFLDVNKSFEELTGLERSAVIGKTVLEVLPETESHWIEIYGEVALSGKPNRFSSYTQALDKYFDVHVFSPASGQFATIFIDTTDIQRSKDALQESENRLLRIVETVPNGIIIMDKVGQIVFANNVAEKILRLDKINIKKGHITIQAGKYRPWRANPFQMRICPLPG